MITPRRIRLLRARDLAGYRSTLTTRVRHFDSGGSSFVLVPTSAAAAQLTRTLHERLGVDARLPRLGSRDDLYDDLRERLPSPARQLTSFEREAILAAGARHAEELGSPPPFHVRPSLVAEMLALYDHIRRLGRSVDDFDRLLRGELEPAADSDRGAQQLLEQTRFLAASFHGYEHRLGESGAADEHALRSQLIATPSSTPLRHLIVAVGDRPFDANGFWPADVALFTTLPGLELIDIVSTEGVLESGFEDRLRLAFVEIEEQADSAPPYAPTLVVPGQDLTFTYRDREDELEGVARRLVSGAQAGIAGADRTALVVARPLPYVYLARDVFSGAGIPFEALDTLPLAAEPYAAAVDLVLECAAANFTRRALTALLRSPHFAFAVDGVTVDRESIAALDFVMAEQRYLGGLDRLRELVEIWTGAERTAARAALLVASTLTPLTVARPIADQVDLLGGFLDQYDVVSGTNHQSIAPGSDSLAPSTAARRQRARAAVRHALNGLSSAYRRHDPSATGTVTELSAAIRRWLGSQTFAQPSGQGGVRILDAHAARFADLDDVQIMGVVEGEWPERVRRNVFYPRSLIAQLEPSRPEKIALNEERDQVRSARAVFRDLASLARVRTRVSTFSLESEAVVEPSTFVDDLAAFGLATEVGEAAAGRVFAYERLAHEPLSVDSSWARIRAANGARAPERFTGEAGPWVLPRVSVSRLERYMKCPFQFFVANVLQVEEEPEDEVSRSPLERGRFLHELFETFFHEWQQRGRGRITAADIDDARQLFAEIAGPALRSLPPAEAGLERARLFGSAVGSGIVDRVFAMEAERGTGIRERLMEYELDGSFTFVGEDGRPRDVRLRAKIDRVDLLADGTFRLIDYKTKYVPDRRQALQLPVYSACVRTALVKTHGREIRASEAMYLSFEGPQPTVALEERGKSFEDLTTAAGQRLVAALDDIAAGHYPSRPDTKNLCTMCAFVAVCRNAGGAVDEDTAAGAERSTSAGEGLDNA